MKIILTLMFMFFVTIFPVAADEPVRLGDEKELPVPLIVNEPANDSAVEPGKNEAKQRFQAPGNPYMIDREFVKDPVSHYRQEIRNEYGNK